MENSDVILIAPTTNQDGSQTFYILDPCPSSEDTDEPSELELIDLSAEVKNTGAIAVLSTNSNTGALEITVTNKGDQIKIETMNQTENAVSSNVLNESNINKEQCTENHSEDNMDVKLEDEELNEHEISFQDIHDFTGSSEIEPKSDVDSLNYEVIELSQQNDTEQEDDIEEGTLYIDDNKCCETQEELAQENLNNVSEQIENEDIQQTVPIIDSITENKGISIEDANNLLQNIEEVKPEEACSEQTGNVTELSNDSEFQVQPNNITCEESYTKDSRPYEAIIHGHRMKIPNSTNNIDVTAGISSIESVENTNTALTLLELAGGSSCKSSVEEDCVELGILQLEGNVNLSSSSLTSTESQPAPELTTLTPLQPVPLEPSIENSFCSEIAAPDTSENQAEHSDTSENQTEHSDIPESQPEQFNTPLAARKVKVSNELVQRLLESEDSSRRPQYKHLVRPSVSKSEIAQEIYERARQKYPYSGESGRDVFFAMKIAHRLASKIVSPEKSSDVLDKSNIEHSSHSTPLTKKDLILKYNEEGRTRPLKRDAISDNIELLKILEDDPDDIPDTNMNQSSVIKEKKPKIKVSRPRAPLLKLHPELEKELALKQLQNFAPTKKKVDFVPEVLKKSDVQGRGRPRKNHEHNNNSQINLTKRKTIDSSARPSKKLKNEAVDEAATADPSQITETLIVEGQDLVEEHLKDGKSLKQYSNKRLSKTSETPPREVPMEILLNGIDGEAEDFENSKNMSKNKIFKATNPRKRQEELKKKHFANVLQRNKPQKKRGRPPKKKPVPTDDMLNKEFLMKVINEQNKPTDADGEKMSKSAVIAEDSKDVGKEDKPLKTKKMREIERLLGDEGAINMLYSVEQKRQTGGEPKRGVLPSYRRKKKDLMLKTKLVKSAVLRLSASPVQTTGRISLRGQGVKDGEEEHSDEVSLRKMSVDSRDSHQSLSSPPTEHFSFPAKIVPAEASRIIRRHSSSSNYSSRSNSPRRLSVDGDRLNLMSPLDSNTLETGQGEDAPVPNATRHNRNTAPVRQANGEVDSKKSENSAFLSNKNCNGNQNEVCFQQPKISLESKRTPAKTPASAKLKPNLLMEQNTVRRSGRPRKKISLDEIKKTTELNTFLAAAVDEFTKETENSKNIPETVPKTGRSVDSGIPSKVAVYKKSSLGTNRKRPGRHYVVYHEVTLKRHPHIVEISLDPVTSIIKNAFNVDVMRELIAVLTGLIKDENCRVVLLTSAGSIFCQGVDFPALIQPTSEQRMTAAQDMALAIKELTKTMAAFPKPIVAVVQGPAVGLGTTLLPLCDLVLATSEATFHTPYARLGHVPEGAATLTLPTLLGYAATSELLFIGRKLTAEEAQQLGLVTRILPAETFKQDFMSVVTTMASQSGQAMSATKALLRHSLLTSLETTLVSETHLLTQHWTSDECQSNFSKYLQNGGQGDPAFVFNQPKQPT